MKPFFFFTLFFSVSLYTLISPIQAGEVVDQIVGIVGDEAITLSELQEATLFNPLSLPDSLILEQLIEHKLLLVQAERETLEVSNEELSVAVENALLDVRSRFPSDEAYKEELIRVGLTEQDLRDRYMKEIQENLLIQKLFQKKFGPELVVSDLEALDFYNTHKDSIPPEPAALRILGVFVLYEISDNARNAARKKADKLLQRIKGGESFGELARQYSDDPLTKSKGGDLGILNRNDMLKEFRDFVSDLEVGETEILETATAYHIIQCAEKYEQFFRLQDIVINIAPTQADSQATLQTLELVEERLKDSLSVDSLYARDISALGGEVQVISWGDMFIPLSQTPFLDSLGAIEINKVYTFSVPQGYQVIRLLEKRPERMPSFAEIRPELKNFVYQRKLNTYYKRLVVQLRREIFVKVLI